MDKYKFRKHKDEYKDLYEAQKNLIQAVVDDLSIEHVGSTAIDGLGGKGILDILVGVRHHSDLRETKEKIEGVGFEFRDMASTDERYFFRRDIDHKGETQRFHLHLVMRDGRDWREMISFREVLRSDRGLCEEYAEIKKEAVATARGDGEKYRTHKEDFIKRFSNDS